MRRLLNSLVYGSPAGPAITIDWERQRVAFHRMSKRRVRRLLLWIARGEQETADL